MLDKMLYDMGMGVFPGVLGIGVSACVLYSKAVVCQDESSHMTIIQAVPLIPRMKQRKTAGGGQSSLNLLGVSHNQLQRL